MTTFFTSDLHLGHTNIIKYERRPFADVDEMNEGLIDKWNSRVDDTDTVIILGDLIMNPYRKKRDNEEQDRVRQERMSLCSRLRGTKRLLMGNHDAGFGSSLLVDTLYREMWLELGGVHVLGYRYEFTCYDKRFLLSHFPWYSDQVDDRRHLSIHHPCRVDYPHVDILLHGHVHGEAVEGSYGWKTNKDMINVGVDVWGYQPVTLEEMLEFYNRGTDVH